MFVVHFTKKQLFNLQMTLNSYLNMRNPLFNLPHFLAILALPLIIIFSIQLADEKTLFFPLSSQFLFNVFVRFFKLIGKFISITNIKFFTFVDFIHTVHVTSFYCFLAFCQILRVFFKKHFMERTVLQLNYNYLLFMFVLILK